MRITDIDPTELLDMYAPLGYPHAGAEAVQDWEHGTTTLTLPDGTRYVVDGPIVHELEDGDE